MFNLTPTVLALLLLNVGVLLLQNAGLFPSETFALHAFTSPFFRPWQLVTYMFMHGGWGHLISNSLSLLFFGALLESHWGRLRFLAFYLTCGVGAGLLYDGIRAWELHGMAQAATEVKAAPDAIGLDRFNENYLQGDADFDRIVVALKNNPDQPEILQAARQAVDEVVSFVTTYSSMLGASGAVFGILFAFGYLFPNTEIYLYFAIPVKAKYFVFFYGAYELFSGVHRTVGDNVAHFAHLGGMLIAFILLKYWERRHPDFY